MRQSEGNILTTPIQPNRLRILREARSLTQKEVAKILEMNHSLVSRHESLDRNIEPKEIEAYARLFKVSSYEIFLEPTEPAEKK